MSLWHWLKGLLTGTPHVRIHNGEYLDRWHLIPRNPLFNIYLHKFIASDPGRDLHDHPWWNVSFLIKGSYFEKTQRGVYRIFRWDFVFRKATDCHAIELMPTVHGDPWDWRTTPYRPVWTIFITGPKTREWGFQTPGGWVAWRDYYRLNGLPLEED